ncbi:hypothetical protein ACFYE8_32750 [Rhizobium leguminosarum]|uniref:hypothetical protein n=1 Tax=Rhizobium leguminosarum TaxID=384 RepID=UPI0036DAAD05
MVNSGQQMLMVIDQYRRNRTAFVMEAISILQWRRCVPHDRQPRRSLFCCCLADAISRPISFIALEELLAAHGYGETIALFRALFGQGA